MKREVSSDAYYYLTEGEEPLDDANLEEAEALKKEFGAGYKITGELIDGSDRVIMTIEPVEASKPEARNSGGPIKGLDRYDYSENFSGDIEIRVKMLPDKKADYAFYNTRLKEYTYLGHGTVEYDAEDKATICNGISRYPIANMTYNPK